MINVYLTKITDSNYFLDLDQSFLSHYRINRINKARSTNFIKEQIISEVFLRYALTNLGVCPKSKIQIEVDERNKPKLINSELKYSIAHSNDYYALAISSNEVGIDIEKVKPRKIDFFDRIATPNETIHLSDKKQEDKVFASLWTRKESVLKLFGLGLTFPMKKIETFSDSLEYHIETQEFKDSVFSFASINKQLFKVNIINQEKIIDFCQNM